MPPLAQRRPRRLESAPLKELEITVTLSTGSVRAHLDDEGGRIDIGKAPVEVIAALLRSVGAPPAAADGIARRVIELRAPSKPASGGARPATEQVFTDVRQLGQVPGIRPEWLAAIVPLATVYGSESVNPLTPPMPIDWREFWDRRSNILLRSRSGSRRSS